MNFPSIIPSIDEAKEKKRRNYPCHTNRASEIGHECERYLVYNRTRWQEKIMYPKELQYIFDHGKWIEKECIAEIDEANNEVMEQQRPFEIEGMGAKITGHIDSRVKLKAGGNVYACEIKGLSPFDWQKLNTIEDFYRSKKSWIKKYPAQLNCYIKGTDESKPGFFYLKNKMAPNTSKEIWMEFDRQYMDELFMKAKRIDDHVKNETLPEAIAFGHSCQNCNFSHICLPEKDYGDGVQLINDPDLPDMLDRKAELKAAFAEYNALDKEIKEKVKGVEQALVGDWYITGEEKERNNKAREASVSRFWQSKYKKVGGTV